MPDEPVPTYQELKKVNEGLFEAVRATAHSYSLLQTALRRLIDERLLSERAIDVLLPALDVADQSLAQVTAQLTALETHPR